MKMIKVAKLSLATVVIGIAVVATIGASYATGYYQASKYLGETYNENVKQLTAYANAVALRSETLEKQLKELQKEEVANANRK